MRLKFTAPLVALAMLCTAAIGPVPVGPKDEIRATFSEFIAAQNAHDLQAVGRVLGDDADFLWSASGNVVRSRAAALGRFRELFQGTWRVDPDWTTYQTLRLDISTVEVFAHAAISSGLSARATRLNVVLINTEKGWRVLTFVVDDLPPK